MGGWEEGIVGHAIANAAFACQRQTHVTATYDLNQLRSLSLLSANMLLPPGILNLILFLPPLEKHRHTPT